MIDPASTAAVAHRLKVLRVALGLTSTEICRRIGSSTQGQTYINYETGYRRISHEHALRLCEEFGLTLDWIYRGLGETKLEPTIRRRLQGVSSLGPLPVFTNRNASRA